MCNRRKWFMFIAQAGILFSMTFYLIWATLNIPYIGVTVQENGQGKWQISDVDQLGWAKQQGIKVGDIVSLVNQTQPGDYSTVVRYGVIEQADTVTIDRNGESIVHTVTNDLNPELVIYHTLIPALVFVILLIFSLFLYLKKRDEEDTSVFILILFFITVGFSYLSAGGSSRIDIPSIYINRITLSLIPALFLEFLNHYFMRYGVNLNNRKIVFAFYLINGLLLVTGSFFLIFGQRLSIIKYSFLAVFSISILICIYILVSSYIRFRKTIHEPLFKIMIFGLMLAFFPFVVLVALPRILFGVELIPGALAAVFLIFLPVVFIYLITANRLFDIDFIIGRIRYYSVLALVPTFLFVLFLIYLLGTEFTLVQRIQVSFVAYTGMIAFLYMKEELDFRFRSKLFREKYNFQASLDRFSHDIAKVMKAADLEERFVTEVKEVLSIQSISLLEMDMKDFSLGIRSGDHDFPNKAILNWMKNNSGSILVGELINIDDGAFLIVGREKDKNYLLWIGEKLNRTQLNQDEKVWLKTIAHYVSIVYENLQLIEGLMKEFDKFIDLKNSASPWILRFLFNLSEKERRRLASDLHDSALQDQLLLYRNLEIIASDTSIPADLRSRLHNVAEGLLDVIHQIRETCNELRPPLLKESGIVEALENLFANAQLRTNYVVLFNAIGFDILLDDEHTLTLYRIVQELLTNATKHSKATQVDITLESSEGIIILSYRDNGIGMDLKHLQSTFNHMGLAGIKERVASLEGEISFDSSLGHGFEVSIWIPVNTILVVGDQTI